MKRLLWCVVVLDSILALHAPVAVRAEVTAPVLLSGRTPGGTPVTAVHAVLDPTDDLLAALRPGESIPLWEVPSTDVSTSGDGYELRVDPARVPAAFITADGVVSVTVRVVAGGSSYVSTVSARTIADPDGYASTWVGAVEPSAHSDRGVRPREYVEAPGADPWPGCSYLYTGSDRTRPTTIGTTYPVGTDTAAMVVSSSSGASYGIGGQFRFASGWGEWKAAGSKFTRSGWGFVWTESGAQRSYRKGIYYRKYLLDCVRGCNECARSWRPVSETGGTSSNTGITRPDWGHCKEVDPGVWWRDHSDGSAYTYGAAVKFAEIIGIDLSISRQYDAHQRIFYRLDRVRRLCGSNTWPASAGKVMAKLAR